MKEGLRYFLRTVALNGVDKGERVVENSGKERKLSYRKLLGKTCTVRKNQNKGSDRNRWLCPSRLVHLSKRNEKQWTAERVGNTESKRAIGARISETLYIIRSHLVYTMMKMGCNWKVWSRKVTITDLYLTRWTLISF